MCRLELDTEKYRYYQANYAKIKMKKEGTDVVGAVGMRPKSACKRLRKAGIATEYVRGRSDIGGQKEEMNVGKTRHR